MKLVVFGHTASSAWGNRHATTWRALIRAMAKRGHYVVFFERDTPEHASARDAVTIPGGELLLYDSWEEALPTARQHLQDSDVAMVTSCCPDGIAATDLILSSRTRVRCFYDLDAAITLAKWKSGQEVPYIAPRGLRDFDIVLSSVGGRAVTELRTVLGARRVVPLFPCVDPQVHRPRLSEGSRQADVCFLGSYAPDRQEKLETLLIGPARRAPGRRFVVAGAGFPRIEPDLENLRFVGHIPLAKHSALFGSSRLALNVTRQAMEDYGHCPAARMFEAAACGTPLVTDAWEGLEDFFAPGFEVIVADTTNDTLAALDYSDTELAELAQAARDRTLVEHTPKARVLEFEAALNLAPSSHAVPHPHIDMKSTLAASGLE